MDYIYTLESYLLFVYWQQILCGAYSDLWSSIFSIRFIFQLVDYDAD